MRETIGQKGGADDVRSYRDEILRWAEGRYGTRPERLWTAYPDYAVLRRTDSGRWYGLIADVPMEKLGLDGGERVDLLNIKCDPRMIGSLRMGPGFLPAYHMDKGHWISVLLDGTVDLGKIWPLLDMSYDLAAKKSGRRRSLKIRHTREEDLPAVMDLYAGARRRMAEDGNPRQWGPSGWPPEDLIREDIRSRKSYVCVRDGKIAAVFFFDAGEDIEPTYAAIRDGQWRDGSAYGVIHRIASDGTVKGAGTACIQWAYARCGHLRIDTHGDNKIMRGLLRKLGFVYCGVVHVREDGDPRLAYEKSEKIEGTDGAVRTDGTKGPEGG